MNKCVQSSCGILEIGDKVRFSSTSGIKTGRIKDITESINSIALSLYCTDDTGAQTLTVPHYNVVELVKKESKLEEIKKPARYNKKGKLECWDVILDQEMNFLEGSVLKYLWRYKEKNGVHDLEKAKVYIDKIISEIKKNETN